MSDLCKNLETLPSARSSFGILRCQLSRLLYAVRKYIHKILMITGGLKVREGKHKITVLSLSSKTAMPLYASAKACAMCSVPKSDISDMQVAMTQDVWSWNLLLFHVPSQATGRSTLSFLQFPLPPHFHPSFKFHSSTKKTK